jgi:uncharacterized protein
VPVNKYHPLALFLTIGSVLAAFWAGALAGVAAGQNPALAFEVHSIKRFMFDCAAVADIRAQFDKRGLLIVTEPVAPKSGEAAGFIGSTGNGIRNTYVIENTGGKLHVYIELRRPQYPIPPLPYSEQEVVFDNPQAGVSLVGTFSYPKTGGAFPAIVLIAGSGAHTRDELVSLHKIFLVLADHLARRGFAVLRYDKRGVGLSGGQADPDSTTDDYASDVRAAVRFLAIQPNVDPRKIGLVGHSEGGIIAPMVAADTPEIAFIVMLAGTGLPGLEIRMHQENALGRASGRDEKAVLANDRLNKSIYPMIIATKDNAAAIRKIRSAEKEVLTAEERKLLEYPDQGFPDEAYRGLLTPWFRRFLELDPRPYLARVRCPVLALNGGKDVQVLADENQDEIKKALAGGGNAGTVVKKLPGINHMFQTAPTGMPNEYRNIVETFAPSALETISSWILGVVGK